MPKPYSQLKAMLAISKASLKSQFKSPQAVFFSLFFPIVLIAIFGAIGGSRGIDVDIAFTKTSDTANYIYQAINNTSVLEVENAPEAELMDRLRKGRIIAMVEINRNPSGGNTAYDVHLKTTEAGKKDLPVLQSILSNIISEVNNRATPRDFSYASVSAEVLPGRPYQMIDFYLPGMLGFSLIGSAVFGVAFVFFAFRETLVLKRLYSTPIRKGYIVVGESLARIVFQLATSVVIILFGKFLYNFTLAHGWITFIELLVLSFLGLVVFMGFGYVISGISKNQNVIPVYANLFMFPQYFLSGTFFPKSALPQGMQGVINFLPLTALNDAMRKVSFEGVHIWNVGREVGVLLAWCVIAYAIAIKVFKWEQ